MLQILALNCGSSSLKFAFCEFSGPAERDAPSVLAHGVIEGFPERPRFSVGGSPLAIEARNAVDAARYVLRWVATSGLRQPGEELIVGHRVVHGGGYFTGPTLVSSDVLDRLDAFTVLAPLHNGPSIEVIRALRDELGGSVQQVASFDTAFHRSMPARARYYAIPPELSPDGHVERYGFHGLAHQSMLETVASARGQAVTSLRLVTLQLGSGCSAAAIEGGRSVDTSMGLTPLEGLMMGTRSGDVDPTLVLVLQRTTGLPADDLIAVLNERSGLLGVSGLSGDLRELLDAEGGGDERVELAIEMFCYRVRKQVGAYLAGLGGADAIVFGGGIGENAPAVRARICEGLAWCGVQVDAALNQHARETARISLPGSAIEVWVATVDEESLIAREAFEVATT